MKLSNQTREDLLVTALEGGSNYWYYLPDVESIRDKYYVTGLSLSEIIFMAVMDGFSVPVHDLENPEEKLGEISKSRIIAGEKTMAEQNSDHFIDALSDNWDATTADIWFQYVVMNEITFG